MKPRKEIEAKFYVSDLEAIRKRLVNGGAGIRFPARREQTLYFDTPDRRLGSREEILRIRMDAASRMTYKRQDGVFEDRTEIEVIVDDASEAQAILQALGYDVALVYEKLRETYEMAGVQVMLDELPLGSFVEVEGPSLAAIRASSKKLGLDWGKRVQVNYLALFEAARERVDFPLHDASFRTFSQLPPLHAADLGLADALLEEKSGRSVS
jgi:adenylate cyclase class 2